MPEAEPAYLQELQRQRAVWERKPVLRLLYRHWHERIAGALSVHRPVLEIGAGCGNFKEYFRDCVATDICKSGPWIDRVLNAEELDLPPRSVGNFVVFDCLHHLSRPLRFLRAAAAALVPGGRLAVCEPAATPWARLVYGLFHHEPCDLTCDVFAADAGRSQPGFSNQAVPELLFWRKLPRTLAAVPDLRLLSRTKFACLLYPLTGGFSYRRFVPAFGFRTALRIEDFLNRPFASWLTGLRMLVVLERKAAP
jgi:SAM-dependent methyltransferase